MDGLVAMGGGGWTRADCAAALTAAGTNLEIACELLLGGFTAAQQSSSPPPPPPPAAAAAAAAAAAVAVGGAAGSAGYVSDLFTCEEICTASIWKVVEADSYGQYPFIYVLLGATHCIVIDTGCGTGNLKEFIDANINRESRPYYVVLTHIHFDHVVSSHELLL